jgi:hypothetical protein
MGLHFVKAMGLGERTRGAMQGVESSNSSPAETETLALYSNFVTIPQGMITVVSHRIEEAR